MTVNAFQASASAHQPARLVITEEESLDTVTPDSAFILAPERDLVALER